MKFSVTVEPEGRKIKVPVEATLFEALNASGISIRSECGGRGVCGKCRIIVKQKERVSGLTDQEMKIMSAAEIANNIRLACQARPMGDLTVFIPPESRLRLRRIQVEGVEAFFKLSPAIRKLRARPPPPSLKDAKANSERLLSYLADNYDLEGLTIGYEALKKLPKILSSSKWDITATIWNGMRVIDIEAEDTTDLAYGFAVDIGTSKIVGQLISLRDGRTVATDSIENPQILHGEDVISRITFASGSEDGLEELRSLVIDGVNHILSSACGKGGVEAENVYEVTIVGNSAMHHILLNIHPWTLAVAPYVPTVRGPLDLESKDVGFQINRGGNVHFLPIVAGFVGSDNIADILSTGIHKSKELTLLIDIGTNTEVNLGNEDSILCCSCASGPAFEGVHIRDGMKAVRGAIERVSIDPGEYSVEFEVVGGGRPIGICGSAMIDILAEMLRCGLIDWTGRINSEAETERIRRREGSLEFVIAWSEETDREKDIVITQADIRELQLAKAAIYTGCSILMRRKGASVSGIRKVFLAGAFGSYIDAENAKVVGIIPDVSTKNVIFVGNAALSGARMALLSTDVRREAAELSEKLVYVEIGADPAFNEELISATYFPHRDLDLFPSARRTLEGRS